MLRFSRSCHFRQFSVSSFPRQKFIDKVALVTASTDGIGLGIAKRLARDGCSVMINSRKQENVDKALKEMQDQGLTNVAGFAADVAKPEQRELLLQATVNEFGGLNFLVPNAGVALAPGPLFKVTDEQWDTMFELNVKSTFFLVKSAANIMLQSSGGHGSVVIIGSFTGIRPFLTFGAYSITKTAMLAMPQLMSEELAPQGIRVNSVLPYLTKTKLTEKILGTPIEKRAVEYTHLGRMSEVGDITGLVSFLCTDDARYITGSNLPIVGGGYVGI